MKKKIGNYYYVLEEGLKVLGDWVVSKHQLENQVGTSEKYHNEAWNQEFEIGIEQCWLDESQNPSILIAGSLGGSALQDRTLKIIETDNPCVK